MLHAKCVNTNACGCFLRVCVHLHVVYVQLSVSWMLKCQPSLFGLLLERCLFAAAGQTDEYVLFDIWKISTLTIQLDIVIFSVHSKLFFSPNLSTKLHKGAFVSVVEKAPYVNDAFVLTAQIRFIAYLFAGEDFKDSAENTKPVWMHNEAFQDNCCNAMESQLIHLWVISEEKFPCSMKFQWKSSQFYTHLWFVRESEFSEWFSWSGLYRQNWTSSVMLLRDEILCRFLATCYHIISKQQKCNIRQHTSRM